jgi:hypothetical protein
MNRCMSQGAPLYIWPETNIILLEKIWLNLRGISSRIQAKL